MKGNQEEIFTADINQEILLTFVFVTLKYFENGKKNFLILKAF